MEAVVAPERKPWYRILYVQVLIAAALGIVVGRLNPEFGKQLKPLSEGFISLIKMLIGPVIFCTVVHGIASMGDLKRVGKVGAKTLLYFEVVSTFALVIGLIVVNVVKPGAGFTPAGQTFHAAEKALKTSSEYIDKAHSLSVVDFFVKLVPKTLISPFVEGDFLQVLVVAILVAFALGHMKSRGERIVTAIDTVSELLFGVIRIVVKLAPIGAFGAMGFTIGQYGIQSLGKLGALMGCFYITSALFIVIVLGVIARLCGFSIFKFIAYIKDELLLVLGTSSSETALPGMLSKMQRLGCQKSTVGLVIPTGYSFNLDGTNIYMAMAAIFLAQATNTPLDLGQQLTLLAVAMLTSKGASGITGAGFITLAATLQAVHSVPVEAVAILVGIDRFMSECRALTNLVGNGVATIAISRWEGEITPEALNTNMHSVTPALAT